MNHEAFEIVGAPRAGAPFVFTCEHATRHTPDWEPEPGDLRFLEDHWGWDIGAGDLTRALAHHTGSAGVLSHFSRLVCDPNRHPEEDSFIVREIEGHRLSINRAVDEAERARRIAHYFDPYHGAIDGTLRAQSAFGTPVHLCAIHSFASEYRGARRAMEVGVLFDVHDDHAIRLAEALREEGFETALNEPYSGFDGLIYSAERHGTAHQVAYLELEIRQDLIDSPERARDVAPRIARALDAFEPRRD